jgi:hypothetical protein
VWTTLCGGGGVPRSHGRTNPLALSAARDDVTLGGRRFHARRAVVSSLGIAEEYRGGAL